MHPCELPDHVVVALLKREALLTRVRLHTARIQQIMNRERLTSLQTKQLQVQGMTCYPSNVVSIWNVALHTWSMCMLYQ